MLQTKQPDCADAKSAAGGIDLRARTPAEMALQLTRNATSLELTGSHIPKDEQFYQAVAADLREAANFLSQWQETIDALRAAHGAQLDRAIADAYGDCAGIAGQIRDIVPDRFEPRAESWRAAAGAILSAILASNLLPMKATAAGEVRS